MNRSSECANSHSQKIDPVPETTRRTFVQDWQREPTVTSSRSTNGSSSPRFEVVLGLPTMRIVVLLMLVGLLNVSRELMKFLEQLIVVGFERR
ncbi:MAG: hypothetical protein H8E66_35385 [Planctomycetes bacterium]|nr:hypothetical protein [Planctomycetota bacterium]